MTFNNPNLNLLNPEFNHVCNIFFQIFSLKPSVKMFQFNITQI